MNRPIVTLLLLTALAVNAGEVQEPATVSVGQPTVHWRNGQWQVQKDGEWVAYADSRLEEAYPPSPAPAVLPKATEEPAQVAAVETPQKIEEPVYYEEFPIGFPAPPPENEAPPARPEPRRNVTSGIGQPNTGIGQPTIGIGQPNISPGPQAPR